MLLLGVIGSVLVATSLLWEYVRTAPKYRFIVEPWSLRGYEVTQGAVLAILGTAVLVMLLITASRRLGPLPLTGMVFAAVVTLGGVVLAIVTDAKEVVAGSFGAYALAGLVGVSLMSIVKSLAPKLLASVPKVVRGLLTLIVVVLLGLLVFVPAFAETSRDAWLVWLIGAGSATFAMALKTPRELGSARITLVAAFVTWGYALLQPASLRITLSNMQRDMGGAADFRELEITSGVMIAWLGGLLAAIGAISLWANRRDVIEAVHRAQRQLEAAQASAEELGQSLSVSGTLEETVEEGIS